MLDHKCGSKMVKISDASYENEIHRVDSPFNEDSKNIFFLAKEALISGKGRPEKLGKMAKTGKPIVMEIWEWSVLIGNTGSTLWYQSLCITLIFLHVRSNYLLKTEEVGFQAKFCPNFAALPSLKLGTFFKC